MPSLVPGKSSCTAWASTCAVECRMTARPSALAEGTGAAVGAGPRAPVRALGVAVRPRRPVQVLEIAGRHLADHDGAVAPLERDPGVLERLHRRRPGRHPDR